MCPHTNVLLWLLPLWFVSVYSSRQEICLFFRVRHFFLQQQQQWTVIYLCGAFSSSHEQNEYLLSAFVTKEMSQHCKQVSYSKWKCANKSSLLAVNEIKWRGKLWGSKRIRRLSSVLILSPWLLISAEQSDVFTTASWNRPRHPWGVAKSQWKWWWWWSILMTWNGKHLIALNK